jgi:GxxExxY protein
MMLDETSDRVIACCFKVHNSLGAGFLERVYENSLMMELAKAGLNARQQVPIAVRYDSVVVGEYFADIVVGDHLICELKASESLSKDHEVQLVNYLAATGFDIGLLINFGRSVTIRRKFRKYSVTNRHGPPEPTIGKIVV